MHSLCKVHRQILCSVHTGTMNAMISRSDEYLSRLDATLAGIQPELRERMLSRQLGYWQKLYDSFLVELENDEPHHPDGPQAIDLFLTICGISKRLAALHSPGGA